ncbi:pseudaminic acid cytidylyltransferase [Leptospira borgpetersenii]|uniref:pseudaminic acid cytidylyltransferase n=1 Tax=Leptospira borgpetersenii TaxID=174 RepID=UPI0007737CC4|nr:pseudaminic acid cytidylyltransferase [Leptospira borgpetersenii]MBE8401275.1 pseudaminic acid cytidylyltransferase [Leptospira borgpetersenii serovar Tarassovi]MBE8403943.1 pseudaminic acid cytidylyltransferase [Leptospira borgpetersenii serovar Tarassovi]MBE8406941.1 pseudaminic acid cytidylyltransferase [Leptospira borgpetersenii serovar Tarassovi]MBE8413340.1 pseudaminic acid cytidylyltransferase [Leptospira borgpetersenii serovar Tarassovi]MBE8416514.1 pseudaminic acid cytidylyltransfe
MKKICIITARGGSKRIPRKNIKEFYGKPILAYPIELALESRLFDEVMVSTDDQEIAEIAKKYSAQIPFLRSEENSNDIIGTDSVLIEVLNEYKSRGIEFDYACCIYPTASLLTLEDLGRAWELLVSKDFDTVFSVIRYGSPIQRALRLKEGGMVSMFHPENLMKRSQDLEPAYYDAGQFYFFNVHRFLNKGRLWTDYCSAIVLDEMNAQDIDNKEDWALAEFKYKYRLSHKIR